MIQTRTPLRRYTHALSLLVATLFASTTLTGCIVAGGSSSGGWFIWPGGLGLLVIILIVIFFMRGRR